MKNIISLSIVAIVLFLLSCGPKVSTTINKKYSPTDYKEDVLVFALKDPIPENAEEIGSIKIGDTGVSTKCGLDIVIEKAKAEARKAGGNAIRIVEHIPPGFASSCHRITATILKVDKSINVNATGENTIDNEAIADYAILYVYRYGAYGALINYDLYLGDSVIHRVTNNSRKTIKINKDGLNTIWARTESKEELPINIKFGNEYYVRCGVKTGALMGRPKIELVDSGAGRIEYQSIKVKSNQKDVIVVDGSEVECVIDREDNENLYITINSNGRDVKTFIKKDRVQSIRRADEF